MKTVAHVADAPETDWRAFHSPALVAEYEQLLAEAPRRGSDALFQVKFARTLTGLGRVDDARERLDEALAIDPTLAAAHYQLGTLESGLEFFEEAQSAFHRALELDPEHAPSWMGLGNVCLALSNARGARDAFGRAHELRADDAEAAFQLSLLIRDEDSERALELLELVAAADPWHLGAPMQLARLHRRAGRADVAQEWMDRHARVALLADLGVLAQPLSAMRFLKEARHYAIHERWSQSLDVCHEGLARYPRDPELHWLSAVACERLDRAEQAAEAYSAALELAPSERAYAIGLAKVIAGSVGPVRREPFEQQLRAAQERWPAEQRFAQALDRLGEH